MLYFWKDKSEFAEVITVNDFNEYVRECFSAVGETVIKSEDKDLIAELLKGMYAELPERKPKKAKRK